MYSPWIPLHCFCRSCSIHGGLRELRSTLKKLIGMRPKLHTSKGGDMTTATAGDARSEQVMLSGMQTWEEYNELLDELELKSTDPVEQVQELEQYISNKKQQYKTERSTGADVSSAATDNLWRKIQYARRLLTTVATNWSDNPAPDKGQYILDVRDFGRWGGQNHSLEVSATQQQRELLAPNMVSKLCLSHAACTIMLQLARTLISSTQFTSCVGLLVASSTSAGVSKYYVMLHWRQHACSTPTCVCAHTGDLWVQVYCNNLKSYKDE